MGKKGKWFSSIKKALSPVSASKKEQEKSKLKGHQTTGVADAVRENYVDPPQQPPLEEIETFGTDINERSSTIILENATDRELAEDEVLPSYVAPMAIEVSGVTQYEGKSIEEVSAIKIQTVFRGYLARRALRALRGLVRLNLLVQGPVVKRQATNTLKCMQTLARVQSQIRSRRVRMSEENEALQRQLLQKHVKELEKVQMSDEWNDSARSKEQVEAKIVNKHEAAMRRERALAYAFTHQQTWKNIPKTPNTMFMNPTNPSWGWSWLERLMSSKPWEQGDKEFNDQSSVKSSKRSSIAIGEISKSYARHNLNLDKPSPTSSPRLSSTGSNRPSTLLKTTSTNIADELNKSSQSLKSNRRHSYAGSSVKDDVVSLHSLPSYMVPTQSAKAKLKLLSPLGLESATAGGTLEKVPSGGLLKKKLSYNASPGRPRRHSGPPKMESSHPIVEQAAVIGVES